MLHSILYSSRIRVPKTNLELRYRDDLQVNEVIDEGRTIFAVDLASNLLQVTKTSQAPSDDDEYPTSLY
jgi:hypothetical protein